jgi:hypothetical protein
MPIQVNVEGLGTLQFPDDTPEDVISAAVRRESAKQDIQENKRPRTLADVEQEYAGTNAPGMFDEVPDKQSSLAFLKGASRYGVPIGVGIATGGAGVIPQVLYGAGSALLGETGAQTVEKLGEGREYRPGEITGATIRGAAPFLKGASGLRTLLKTGTAAGGAGVLGGAAEGTVTGIGSAAKEFGISGGLAGLPTAFSEGLGATSRALQTMAERAGILEKAGVTPLVTDVMPQFAAFAQRAQSKLGSGQLRQLEENQLRQLEERARQMGGIEGVPDVRQVYSDAVTLLGLNKVNEIANQAGNFSSATQALSKAVDDAKSYGQRLIQEGQTAFGEAKTRELTDAENAYNEFVQGLGAKTEQQAAETLAPMIESQRKAATQAAFPGGVPQEMDVARRGMQLQQLITQPEKGGAPGMKQLTDQFFTEQYKGIPSKERLFTLNDTPPGSDTTVIDQVNSLISSIPKTGMPGLEDILKGINRTEAAVLPSSMGMVTTQVPSKFSLDELRGLRTNLENWAYTQEAYGKPAQAKAKQLANSITAVLNKQAPDVFAPDVAQKFFDTQAKYAQVRELWENPLVESAFRGVEATPEKMVERMGSAVLKSGTLASDYRGITTLIDNLKDIGVQGIPDRSQINSMVQQYIAKQSLSNTGDIDNLLLLANLNKMERTAPGSVRELGFGDLAGLRNFDVINNIVQQSKTAGKIDYRTLLSNLNQLESQKTGTLRSLGLGSISDIEQLNRRVSALEGTASDLAKAKEIIKSDSTAGYQVGERIMKLLDDSKDVRSLMDVMRDQIRTAATPELAKQAANALVNTRAAKIEDILFGRTAEGVSKGAGSVDVEQLKRSLGTPSVRQEYADIVGEPILQQIEKEFIPALEVIAERTRRAGGAGQTTGGQAIENLAISSAKAPAAGLIWLLKTGDLPTSIGVTLAAKAIDVGGTALASKLLARQVGATGLKSKTAAAASLKSLLDRVNKAPNREAARKLMTDYANSGELPQGTSE